jgi:uncharacterized OsmC-like protein
MTMPRDVLVRTGPSRFQQDISVGPHRLKSDEPSEYGGNDAGATPYELLLAALGACTSMTVRMYAERKQWPLDAVQVSLSHDRVHAEDCAECETKEGLVDRIAMTISFTGHLSSEQRKRLLEIAGRCPVHRTLDSRIQINTRLVGENQPAA